MCRGVYQYIGAPHTMRFAKINLVLWSLCVFSAVVALILALTPPRSLFWAAWDIAVVTFDTVMLQQAVKGYFYRTDIARQEAELRRFIEVLQEGYSRDDPATNA